MPLRNGLTIRQNNQALCIVSAMLLATAFWWPAVCGWFVFLFMAPLVAGNRMSFAYGLLWGIVFFGLHYYGLLCVVIERGSGALRVLLLALFLLYSALHAGVWFWITGMLVRVRMSCVWQGSVQVVVTWAYFFFIRFYLLWGFGACDGYPFAVPLVPLAAYPQWLAALPLLTSYGLLVCLLVVEVAIVHAIVCRERWLLIIACVAFVPFSYGWFFQRGEQGVPAYVDTFGYVAPPVANCPLQCAQELCYAMQKLLERSPHVKIIFTPESAFPWPLNDNLWAVRLWSDNALLSPERKFCVGAYRREGASAYNSMFYLNNSRIIKYYDKIKLMLFTEYVTPLLQQLTCVQQLFLNNEKGFSATESVREAFVLDDSCVVQPCICSDLFFNVPVCNGPDDIPFLVLVNDSWFSASYMRDLMFLFARLAALERQRTFIYVGHYAGFWITKTGRVLSF